ncbi:MAG TPA: BMP family ABC transporter substrate-binding protein, partial [Gaiellaceae bacterium]|nr:BMP family ABC transporter substrate-binding protein [Gaiellaceae bacterium]
EGHDSELVADLDHLVEANPLRERLRGQLMVALYRSGRQADALEIYQRGRRHLVDELGLEPSEGLRRLEARILQQDPALERPSAALPTKEPDGAPRRSRRLALVGTTAFILAAIAAGILIATTGPTAGRPAAASLRVALVANELRSQSLTDSSRQGVDPIDGLHVAAEEDGVRARILYGGPSATRFLKTVAAAARTSDFVIVEATPELEALSRLTRRFPNTQFFVPDTVLDPLASFRGQKNVTGANFDDRENGYLGGYLAGLMAPQHGSVSAVGGIPTQSVRDLVAGFSRGARSARPGIRVRVDYSGTFVDQAPCEKLANRQIDRGSAVVFDVAGNCGIGAVAAAGIRGVWALGVDSDMSSTNSQVLASVVKHFDRATQLAVTLFATGRLPGGQDLRLDLSSGGIGLVGINSRVPQGVRVKVEAVAAQLRAHDQAPGAR